MRIGSCIQMVLLAGATLAGATLRAAEQGSAPANRAKEANAAPPAAQKWGDFAPAGLGFKIELTGKPVERSGWVDLPTSKIYAWNFVLADEAGGRTTTVIVNTCSTLKPPASVLCTRIV